jgi:glycosyltransferase involved in cell wall biosynthesis
MILAYVCDVFPPYSSISAATLNYDWAKEACAQGHKVVVITPDPTITEPYTDTVDAEFGFRVIRVKTDSLKVKWAKSTGGKRFIDKFLRAWAEIKAPYHMIEAIKKNDDMPMFDGVVFYSPTVFFAPVIKFLKQRSSCPVYQILRDLYPDQLVEMKEIHRHSPSYFLMKWATGQQHNLSDCIAVESGAVKKKMVATGFGQYPLEILNNWMTPAPNTGCSLDLSQTKLAGKKVFVYAGTMGTAQRVESFIDLADRLRDHSDIGFLLIGPGDQKDFLQQKIQSLGLSNVMMHDGISATEIPGLFAQCSAGPTLNKYRQYSWQIDGLCTCGTSYACHRTTDKRFAGPGPKKQSRCCRDHRSWTSRKHR